jgi:hypothetical protein
MRTPFGWTLRRQNPLQILCACFVLWSLPAASLGMPTQITQTHTLPSEVTPTPIVSTPAQTSVHALAPAPALAPASASTSASAPVPVPAPASVPTPTSPAKHNTVRIGGIAFDRRVLALVATVCFVGTIAGWATRGPRVLRVRLLNKPTKTHLTVLVPPGPTPRLVPNESRNATRARSTLAPVSRLAPSGPGSGIIDYIAPFASSGEASERVQVDYLLDPGDCGDGDCR